MRRRGRVVTALALGCVGPAAAQTARGADPTVVPLWAAGAPDALGVTPDDQPSLTVYRPAKARATGAAVVVFPGGGYDHLSLDREGAQVARWLNDLGIAAFVARYRVGPRYRHPTMRLDALRAVRVVREGAARWGLDPHRVGVIGFSAGGHMAGTVGTRFAAGDSTSSDAIERVSARPDFMVLVYPVVTMGDRYGHRGSQVNLLGDSASANLVRETSVDLHVTADTPPTFLVATSDDATVPVENTTMLFRALRDAGVSTEMHVFQTGRHGFALAAGDSALSAWTRLCATWLRTNGWLGSKTPRVVAGRTRRDSVPAGRYAAVVDAASTSRDGVPVNGLPTFTTLGAALAAAPAKAVRPHVVLLRNGRYREKLSVDKPNIALVGESRDGTVITFDAVADTPAPGGGTLGTRGSFTLRVTAPDFRAEHLTIENTFDYAGNAAKPDSDPTKVRNTQALALATTDGSDRAVFDDVKLLGGQDTFFANAGRHYFHRCVIAGHVDFIFGAGQVVFDDCDIISRDRGDSTNNGYITAPSTDVGKPYGFLFVRSRLKKESPRMAPRSVALGRPWHPSATPTAMGSAVFIACWMDNHISPMGWDRMSSVDSTTKVRYWFEPGNARFFEYGSTGPGAITSATRRVLSDGDARTYTIDRVLGGWTPVIRPR